VIAIDIDRIHHSNQAAASLPADDKVIPWAEGNGLWDSISRLASNLVGVDIATFFVQNPYTCDSAQSLAERIGRPQEEVEPVLEGFAEANLLHTVDLGEIRIYELTNEPHRRQTLQQYVAWLREGYHWARMVMDPDPPDLPASNTE
jgi:hypothetical protein